MLTHAQIWTAIDRLASLGGLSPSGLARKSGLDPTTFNKSKRMTRNGRARWPSTESVAKALAATGTSIDAFVQLIDGTARHVINKNVPFISLAHAAKHGYFDGSGFPIGDGWEELAIPMLADEHSYALEISGHSMEPAYPEGALIIVSPAAAIRRGDRVVVKTKDNKLMIKELKRRTGRTIELRSIDSEHGEHALPAREVFWIARIVWVSQ